MGLEKLVPGDSIIDYSAGLAAKLFDGILRDSGLPYTQEHLEKAAERMSLIAKPGVYRRPAIASCWLHDAPEDIKNIDVYDPYNDDYPKTNKILLNDLLEPANEEGRSVCYMVNLVTNRSQEGYHQYVGKIFDFPADSPKRELHTMAGVLKSIDIRLNTNPDERANFNKVVRQYLALESADRTDLEEFYKKTKTIDAFRAKKDYRVDVDLFTRTLRKRHKERQMARAFNNLALYLPLAERRLLVDTPRNNELFDWDLMRGLLKEAFIDSLRQFPGGIHQVRMMGYNNRAPKIDGYTSIRREVREEIFSGKLKIKKAF